MNVSGDEQFFEESPRSTTPLPPEEARRILEELEKEKQQKEIKGKMKSIAAKLKPRKAEKEEKPVS